MARSITAVLVFVLSLAGIAGLRAQTRSRSDDIMPLLLEEVRGLRAAMEQMASTGARVQLGLGRLQMQEQRLNNAIKRLEETRTRLTQLQRGAAEQQEQLAMLEISLKEESARQPSNQPHEGPTEHQMEAMLKQLRMQGDLTAGEITSLMGEESALTSEVAAEQARWNDLNARLEEIERGLR